MDSDDRHLSSEEIEQWILDEGVSPGDAWELRGLQIHHEDWKDAAPSRDLVAAAMDEIDRERRQRRAVRWQVCGSLAVIGLAIALLVPGFLDSLPWQAPGKRASLAWAAAEPDAPVALSSSNADVRVGRELEADLQGVERRLVGMRSSRELSSRRRLSDLQHRLSQFGARLNQQGFHVR